MDSNEILAQAVERSKREAAERDRNAQEEWDRMQQHDLLESAWSNIYTFQAADGSHWKGWHSKISAFCDKVRVTGLADRLIGSAQRLLTSDVVRQGAKDAISLIFAGLSEGDTAVASQLAVLSEQSPSETNHNWMAVFRDGSGWFELLMHPEDIEGWERRARESSEDSLPNIADPVTYKALSDINGGKPAASTIQNRIRELRGGPQAFPEPRQFGDGKPDIFSYSEILSSLRQIWPQCGWPKSFSKVSDILRRTEQERAAQSDQDG